VNRSCARRLSDEYFVTAKQRLQPLIVDGLVLGTPLDIRVTSRGRLLLRIIAMCFDAYLHHNTQTARYSRVIWLARLFKQSWQQLACSISFLPLTSDHDD
jgi:hypothetical protein